MSVAIITGSAGLVGSEAAAYFSSLGMNVIGVDNGMRAEFFGPGASTGWMRTRLQENIPLYKHYDVDIRDRDGVNAVFQRHAGAISLVVHTAAQPSHDWAATNPSVDFAVNATGTSVLLEATRLHAPDSVFIFTSTNKVYGDTPNELPLIETDTRWEIDLSHPYHEHGVPESMSLDQTIHSLFGASKVAADILVQEYGRYFGMRTVCFRGGCLTGPNHSGTQMHGFLAYLLRCAVTEKPYTIFGYKGKQVRDNIHSADLIRAFHEVLKDPGCGDVYNMGGGRYSNCSMREAIGLCEHLINKPLTATYIDKPRRGDHMWWISDSSRFRRRYPAWKQQFDVPAILRDIYEKNVERWMHECSIEASETSLAF